MKYSRIISALCRDPWLIKPEKLEEILALIEVRASGVTLTDAERKIQGASKKKYSGVNGNVQVIPLFGTIAQRISLMAEASGGTSIQQFDDDYTRALNDPNVGAILCDIASPGGSVYGVQEMAAKVLANRGKKPQVAIANAQACSAAFWLGASFDELVVTPSGEVGSVGVVMCHCDYSAQNEAAGVKVTYITEGKFKAEGNPDEPLSDDAKAEWQATAARYYASFLDGLADARGVTTRKVKADFGQGRVFGAQDAVKRGMADRVAPFEQVLAELNAGRPTRPRTPGDGGTRGYRSVEQRRRDLRELIARGARRDAEFAARMRSQSGDTNRALRLRLEQLRRRSSTTGRPVP